MEEIRQEVLLSTMSQVASRNPVGVDIQIERPRSKSRPAARHVQSAPASFANPTVAITMVQATKCENARDIPRAYHKAERSSSRG